MSAGVFGAIQNTICTRNKRDWHRRKLKARGSSRLDWHRRKLRARASAFAWTEVAGTER